MPVKFNIGYTVAFGEIKATVVGYKKINNRWNVVLKKLIGGEINILCEQLERHS